MAARSYDDAMNDALERLTMVGFDQAGGYASHATMGAEALSALGCYDQVADWVEWNKGFRYYNDEPRPTERIAADDEDAWRGALGTFERAADLTAMFEREIAERGWRDVLITWWPRLLPGLLGGLTHGLIRTAHAVRGVAGDRPPSALQLRELAHGLGYWAAVFTPVPGEPRGGGATSGDADPMSADAVREALSDLTARCAGVYAKTWAPNPVPLVHTVTAPAAVRLVLPSLPAKLHDPSYRAVARVAEALVGWFGSGPRHPDAPEETVAEDLTPEAVRSEAVELKDEHAIKLAEAAGREYAIRPDERYLAASWMLTERMKTFMWIGPRGARPENPPVR